MSDFQAKKRPNREQSSRESHPIENDFQSNKRFNRERSSRKRSYAESDPIAIPLARGKALIRPQ